MKIINLSVAAFVFCLCLPVKTIQAERGDLYSYELLEHFEHEDVVDFFTGQFSGYINPEEAPELFELATAFFEQLIDQRSMSVYKMVYETVDFYGNPTDASGIIMIPGHEDFTCTRSFSLYGHGTVFDREGVNSRPQNWGGEFMLALMMASINTICVAPDYYGLGDGDGFHHHNTYRTNVNSSLDAVRAGRNLCDLLGVAYNNRLLPMGYSEGGHASMGVARMVREESLQEEFRIAFVGAGSGAYDMSGEAFDFILGDPYYLTPQYILYQAATCEDIYGNILMEEEGETYSDFLLPPFDELFVEHVLSQDGNLGWVVRPWTDMFRPEKIAEITNDLNHPLRQCLANSNVYDWHNRYPTFMYYCTTDGQVPYTGALKTRDVQRSRIPWYLFWERFRIVALDLTLGDLIPSHEACALPSIFVQISLMAKNLGLQCEFTGREEAAGLRTSSGERIDQSILFSPRSIDMSELAGRLSGPVSLYGMNMQTGAILSSDGRSPVRLEENGFYIIRISRPDGTSELTWLYKADPDFVNTSDYDPIRDNPMQDRTVLDLSLLEEAVREVVILDWDGNQHLSLPVEAGAASVELFRQPSMSDGDYTVEVRTAENTYPLKLEVAAAEAAGLQKAGIYPAPVMDMLHARLPDCPVGKTAVSVYSISGKLVYSGVLPVSECSIQLDAAKLSPGVYTLRVMGGSEPYTQTFVKAPR